MQSSVEVKRSAAFRPEPVRRRFRPLEFLIAARHDPDMRGYLKPLEREFGRANFELSKALLGEQCAADEGFTDFCVVVINSMPGAAASRSGSASTGGVKAATQPAVPRPHSR
jgi:hypothetical protein